MKKILFITFSYVPYNVTGTFRAMRFIKYLPKYKLKPIVVTADQGRHHWNEKLFDEIPEEAEIIRLKSFFKDSQERQNSSKFYKVTSNNKFILSRVLKIIKDIFFSPDIQITWCIRWFWKIVKVIRKFETKTIVITGAPFSLFILGVILKKITNVKVIVDYRDSWLNDSYQNNQSRIRKINNKWMEKFVLNNIDYLISTTSTIINDIKARYDFVNSKVIYNGFDPNDYKNISLKFNNGDIFKILYAGKFNINDIAYNPKNVLLGVKNFLEDKKNVKIELIVCGSVNKETKKWIEENNIDFVKIQGFIKRDLLINLESEADAFLHFYFPRKIIDTISIKIFEYAQFKKPIISINTEMSEVSILLKKAKLGLVCENDSLEDISHTINQLVKIKKEDFEKNINYNEINKYNQIILTKSLSNIIYSLES